MLRAATMTLACVLLIVSRAAGAKGESVVRGVHLLALGDRVSIVVELDGKVAGATTVKVDETDVFVVDIGPVSAAPGPEVLRAAPTSRLVSEASVQHVNSASNRPLVRVRVKLKAAATGSVRVADRRVYLDFAPASKRPEAPALVSNEPPVLKVIPPSRTPPPSGTAAPAVVSPQPPIDTRDESRELLIERAKALARVPDVKALVELRARAARLPRASVPADAASKVPDPTLAQIDDYLAEAQRLQLARDAQLFRQEQAKAYVAALRQVASDLDAINAGLRSTKQPSPESSSALAAKLSQLVARLDAIEPPAELATAHARAGAAAKEAVAGIARTEGAPPSTADAQAFVDRARAALTETLAAVSVR